MSAGLELIRERMRAFLEEHGVRALTAWHAEERVELSEPVAVVSLRRCQAGPSGFQDYLGDRYNEDAGRWEELYGRRVKLTFGLDLYAGTKVGEGAVQSAFDTVVLAFQNGAPEGLNLVEISCGETVYDDRERLLRRPVEAVCSAYLYAVTEPGGAFIDFEIRGGIRQ